MPDRAKHNGFILRTLDRALPEGKLSRKAVGVAVGRVLQFGAVLAVNAWLARVLLPEVFGDYQKLWLLVFAFSPLMLMGLPQSAGVFLPRLVLGERDRVVINVLFFQVLGAIPFLSVFFLMPEWLAILIKAPHLAPLIPLVGIYLCLALPTFYLEIICVVEDRIKYFIFVLTIHAALFTLAHIVCALGGSLYVLLYGIIAVMAVRLSFTIWITIYSYGPIRLKFSRTFQRRIFTYAAPLFITALLDVLTVNIDKFIVSQLFTAREFAIYNLGAIEVPLIFLIISAITSVLIPEMAKCKDKSRMEYLIRASCGRLAFILIPLFFFGLVSADFIIPLFFSETYRQTIPIFAIYLFLIPQRVLHLYPVLLTKNLKRHIIAGRLLDLAVNVTLALILAPTLGLWAPAIAVVVATHFHKLYFLILVRKKLDLKLSRIIPWQYLTILTLSSATLAWAFMAIRREFSHVWLGFILGAALFSTVWMIAAYFERKRSF